MRAEMTPQFVAGGTFRIKQPSLCAVTELGEAGSVFPARCDDITQLWVGTAQVCGDLAGFIRFLLQKGLIKGFKVSFVFQVLQGL